MGLKGNPSVVDVAKQAGVALGTASRVLNDNPTVAPELREKVLAAARRLGFSPRHARPSLALLAPVPGAQQSWGYFQAILSHLWRAANEKGFPLELIHAGEPTGALSPHIKGIVSFAGAARNLGAGPLPPVVTIHQPMIERGFHHVYTDHREQGRTAAAHLLDRGHRRIGLLLPNRSEWGAASRHEGVCEALRQKGLAQSGSLFLAEGSLPLADTLASWLRQGVTALLNFNEALALETIHVLTNVLGRPIGTGISVISVEDLPIYQYLFPPQTAIRQPLAELCRAAVDFVTGPQGAVRELCLPFELVARESVSSRVPAKKRVGGDGLSGKTKVLTPSRRPPRAGKKLPR